MKARYIGDRRSEEGPRRVRFAGISFPRDVFVPVDEIPDLLKEKLRGNTFFEVSDKAITAEDEAALERADNANAPRDAFDQDGDGDPGGPVQSPEKDQLLDQLDALVAANPEAKIEFDRRWGAKRLAEALEAAKFELGDVE